MQAEYLNMCLRRVVAIPPTQIHFNFNLLIYIPEYLLLFPQFYLECSEKHLLAEIGWLQAGLGKCEVMRKKS